MEQFTSPFGLGVLLGLSIAIPVGPMALLAVEHTLVRGLRHGLASSLGAAAGDTFYGAAAALGLVLVTDAVQAHQAALRLFGGAILCGLGFFSLRAASAQNVPPAGGPGVGAAGLSGLLVTATNPITIVAFSAIMLQARWVGSRPLLIGGVFAGSFLWYAGLCAAAFRFRDRLSRRLRWIKAATVGALFLGGALGIAAGAAELWTQRW